MTNKADKSECSNAGTHRVIPTLSLKNAAGAIELYKKAFGAVEQYRMMDPSGKTLAHGSIKIGDTEMFLGEAQPSCPAIPGQAFYIYVPNADAAFKQAKDAGCKEDRALEDMFWGDRTGTVIDSNGIKWTLATHVRDVSPEELQEGMKKMIAGKAA